MNCERRRDGNWSLGRASQFPGGDPQEGYAEAEIQRPGEKPSDKWGIWSWEKTDAHTQGRGFQELHNRPTCTMQGGSSRLEVTQQHSFVPVGKQPSFWDPWLSPNILILLSSPSEISTHNHENPRVLWVTFWLTALTLQLYKLLGFSRVPKASFHSLGSQGLS